MAGIFDFKRKEPSQSTPIQSGSTPAETGKNYTPLNQGKVKKGGRPDHLNTILLIVAIVTAVSLAGVLVVLVRNNFQSEPKPESVPIEAAPTEEVIPTELPEEEVTASPSPQLGTPTVTPPQTSVTPSPSPTPSPTPGP